VFELVVDFVPFFLNSRAVAATVRQGQSTVER
jgi:hypothetical protein